MKRWLSRPGRRALTVLLSILVLAMSLFPSKVIAHGDPTDPHHSHFRYAHITWVPASNDPANRTVHFTFMAGFRRNGYGGSAPDGLAAVGDLIDEYIGGTRFQYGDGSFTGQLKFRVKAINVAENWLLAVALEPGNPAKETLTKTYNGPGPYVAGYNECCRISALQNVNDYYIMKTTVRPGAGNRSPISSLPAIVTVGRNTNGAQPPVTFTIPAADPDGDGVRFRIASGADSGIYNQVPNISVDPITGVFSWQNAGVPLGLWATQVIIEDVDAAGNVRTQAPVDFIMNLVQQTSVAPVFVAPTPAQGSTVNFSPGVSQTLEIRAQDGDAGQTVTLNHAGLPAGATFTASAGNPAVGFLTWMPTPADAGSTHVVTFYANDDAVPSQQSLRSFTLQVASDCTGLFWKAPLSGSATYNMPNGSVLPIRFGWCPGGSFVHDESVVVQIYDLDNDYPVAAWVYQYDVVIDDAAQEYRQNFLSAEYGLPVGTRLEVQVFMQDQLVGTARVDVAP